MDYTRIEYPDHVFHINEIAVLSEVIDKEMQKLGVEIDNLENDTAIETSTEYGIGRREKCLGIVPRDTYTLDDRRQILLMRYSDRAIYTKGYLIKYLDMELGPGNYTLEIDSENQILELRVNLEEEKYFEQIQDFIERIVPLHIKTDVSLLFNTWRKIGLTTWTTVDSESWNHWKEDVL